MLYSAAHARGAIEQEGEGLPAKKRVVKSEIGFLRGVRGT